jgi:hypothetical protein
VTPEEAVERILQGVPWVMCKTCKNTGNDPRMTAEYAEAARTARPFEEVRFEDYHKDCPDCGGAGSHFEPKYVEACEVLNKPLPKPFSRKVEFKVYETIATDVQVNPKAVKLLIDMLEKYDP